MLTLVFIKSRLCLNKAAPPTRLNTSFGFLYKANYHHLRVNIDKKHFVGNILTFLEHKVHLPCTVSKGSLM